MKREESTIRKDVLRDLDRLFPDDEIRPDMDFDESYFLDISDDVRRKLSKIKSATINYERDRDSGDAIESGRGPSEHFDDFGECDDLSYVMEEDFSSSYHLYFLALRDRRFRFKNEFETIDDDENIIQVKGESHVGCCVAISLLAPYASIFTETQITYEDGSVSYPDIESNVFFGSEEPVTMDDVVRKNAGDAAVKAIKELAGEIASILESHGITTLPTDELEKRAPWLESDPEVLLNKAIYGGSHRVQDALFFRMI